LRRRGNGARGSVGKRTAAALLCCPGGLENICSPDGPHPPYSYHASFQTGCGTLYAATQRRGLAFSVATSGPSLRRILRWYAILRVPGGRARSPTSPSGLYPAGLHFTQPPRCLAHRDGDERVPGWPELCIAPSARREIMVVANWSPHLREPRSVGTQPGVDSEGDAGLCACYLPTQPRGNAAGFVPASAAVHGPASPGTWPPGFSQLT
jgi:hypothetical protein